MLKKLAVATLAAMLVAVNAPVAHASAVYYDCSVVAAANSVVSPDTYTGLIVGVAVDTASHTLRCYIRAGGTEVASTPTQGPSPVVVTEALVSFTVPQDSVAQICTELDGVTVSCSEVSVLQVPPQAVVDLLNSVLTTLGDVVTTVYDGLPESLRFFLDNVKPGNVDPLLCPILKALSPGVPGVDITPEGDTTILGEPVWDCPPYGNLGPTTIPYPYVYVMVGSDHSKP